MRGCSVSPTRWSGPPTSRRFASIRFRPYSRESRGKSGTSTPASKTTRANFRRRTTTDLDELRPEAAPNDEKRIPLGRAHAGQEDVDLARQLLGLLREIGGGGKNMAGGATGLVGRGADAT